MLQAVDYQPLVLVETADLSREEWLSYRRQGLGGNDAAAVLGISPFWIAVDLYYDKRNLPIEDEEGNWGAMEVGSLLEDFARRVMHPRKSMVHCFQYINRKAWDYIQDELKTNGITPGTGQDMYGSDIPDDLCYQCLGLMRHFAFGVGNKNRQFIFLYPFMKIRLSAGWKVCTEDEVFRYQLNVKHKQRSVVLCLKSTLRLCRFPLTSAF